jgi:hypothetical protein
LVRDQKRFAEGTDLGSNATLAKATKVVFVQQLHPTDPSPQPAKLPWLLGSND